MLQTYHWDLLELTPFFMVELFLNNLVSHLDVLVPICKSSFVTSAAQLPAAYAQLATLSSSKMELYSRVHSLYRNGLVNLSSLQNFQSFLRVN